MATRFVSGYLRPGAGYEWLRGNHHGHSTVSDGELSPVEIVRAYEDAGLQHLALSEHDIRLDPGTLRPHTRMTILPAVETTAMTGQTLLCLGIDRALPARALTPKGVMDETHKAGGLFVFDHPNWQPWPSYATDDLLDSMEGMQGMEIYTGVIERLTGRADATDRWDRQLSRGQRLFGHATDDQHGQEDLFVGWNCVQWPTDQAPSPSGIVAALATGRFYASTGVTIARLELDPDDNRIVLESDADRIRWICRGGVCVNQIPSGACAFTLDEFAGWPVVWDAVWPASTGVPTDAMYLRAECLGRGGAKAWTQPFWVTAAAATAARQGACPGSTGA